MTMRKFPIFSRKSIWKKNLYSIFLVITGDEDQPFEVRIRYTYHLSIYAGVTIQISDTIATIKLKYLEEHKLKLNIRSFGENLHENIKRYKLEPRPLDCYRLYLDDTTEELENEKTAQDYNVDSYSAFKLVKVKLLRFHFENTERVIEKSMSIWPRGLCVSDTRSYYRNFKEKSNQFCKEYNVRKKNIRIVCNSGGEAIARPLKNFNDWENYGCCDKDIINLVVLEPKHPCNIL